MKAVRLALILIAMFVAIMVAAHYCVWGLNLNLEIKPLDLAVLMVNLFIALFLTQYFADKAGNLRAEKDLLITDLRSVLGDVRTCREALIACQDVGKISKADKKLIISTLRRVANGTKLAESALKMSQLSAVSEDTLEGITRAYIQFKTSASGGSFPAPFTPDQISDQERDYLGFVQKLHALLFKINGHS
jgi:hypothetical protein